MSFRSFVFGLMLAAAPLLAGCGLPSFLVTPVSNPGKLEEQQVQPGKGWSPGKIAIVEVEGMLINSRGGGGSLLGLNLGVSENPLSKFTQQLDAAEKDSSVKAVVLRINSPGGTVTSSDTMYELVRRFRERSGKPVIASTQEVCASGGYYVALACDQIIVQPTSVVGSIGVVFESVQFKGTMDKLGVSLTAIKSGYLKDMGSPWKLLQDDERKLMQEMVDEYFERFVALVRKSRPVKESATDLDEYKKASYAGVFSGRVFSGAKAVELGLADKTGLLADALDEARRLAKAPNAAAVLYVRPYGYGGSIYATTDVPNPQAANTLRVALPDSATPLPAGFYYLWRP